MGVYSPSKKWLPSNSKEIQIWESGMTLELENTLIKNTEVSLEARFHIQYQVWMKESSGGN